MIIGSVGIAPSAAPAEAVQGVDLEPAPASGGLTPLERVLRADGSVDLGSGVQGALDPAGWTLEPGAGGAPRFVRTGLTHSAPARPAAAATPDEYWDPRFNGLGADAQVR